MYHHPESLYVLSKKEHDDKKVQEDYNNLHEDFRYHNITFYGLPTKILLVDPRFIKYLKFN